MEVYIFNWQKYKKKKIKFKSGSEYKRTKTIIINKVGKKKLNRPPIYNSILIYC